MVTGGGNAIPGVALGKGPALRTESTFTSSADATSESTEDPPARTGNLLRGLIVWTLVASAVLITVVGPWLEFDPNIQFLVVCAANACAVLTAMVMAPHVRGKALSLSYWISAWLAMLVLPLAIAGLYFWPDLSTSWSIQVAGAFTVAWCVTLHRFLEGGGRSFLSRVVLLGVLGLCASAIVFAAFWWMVPWARNAAWSRSVGGWDWAAPWLAQVALVFGAAAVPLMIIGWWTDGSWKRLLRGWSGRDTVTVALSGLALTVSIVGLIYPLVSQAIDDRLSAKKYLEHLIGGSGYTVEFAKWNAEPDSPAQALAQRIKWIWVGTDSTAEEGGSVESDGSFASRFRVCFPSLPTIPLGCATADDFTFSDSGRVMDFSLDGVPISAQFENNNLSEREWDSHVLGDRGTVRIVQIASLRGLTPAIDASHYPTVDSTTVLFNVISTKPAEAKLTDVTMTDLAGDEQLVTWFPFILGATDYSSYWAVNVGSQDGRLKLCYELSAGNTRCETYNVWD